MKNHQKQQRQKAGKKKGKKVCPGFELRPRQTQNRPDIFFPFLFIISTLD